jgi:uncharacterized metal-binding protein
MPERRDDQPAGDGGPSEQHELVRVRKTDVSCGLCEAYTKRHRGTPIAVLSCEGGCLRGEISRMTANAVCQMLPEKTVRICLGSAFTKDSGQRALVRDATQVVVLQGCAIDCASRMMEGVLPGRAFDVIHTDQLGRFDKGLFPIDSMTHEQVAAVAAEVARAVVEKIG